MSQHTPGPWYKGQEGGNGEWGIFKDGEGRMRFVPNQGTTLYPICHVVHGWEEGEDLANSYLIEAAPNLLTAGEAALLALRELARYAGDAPEWNEGGWAYEACESLRQAITKARPAP